MDYIIRQEQERAYEITERVVKYAFIATEESDKDEYNLTTTYTLMQKDGS